MCSLLFLLFLLAASPTSAPGDDISPEWYSHPSEVGDKCEFRLKQVAMMAEEIIVTGEVYNGCKVSLEVDTGMLSRSMLWDLKMFSVSKPFVYYVTTPEGLRISYYDQYRLVDPGETITFTQRRRLRPRRPRRPGQFELVEFLTRAATNIPRAPEERVTMLPAGEYGMTARVALHYRPAPGKPQTEYVDLPARNMLWVRVTDQGELLPLSGVTSQASDDRNSGSGPRSGAGDIRDNTGLLADGITQKGGRSPSTAPAGGVRPGPGCSQVAADWLAPGVVLCRVSQNFLADDLARQWLAEHDCVLPLTASGLPHEVFERVAIRQEDGWVPVNWPADLQGKVAIRSEADALAFVRLFSSPDTWYCFPHFGCIEVRVTGRDLPRAGEVESSTFAEWRLSAASVRMHNGVYRVTRPVVRVTNLFEATAVEILDEAVGPDGTYTLGVLCSKALRGPERTRVYLPQPK